MIYLTLNQIRACSPCKTGWTELLLALGKTEADDEPIPLSFILESNGIEDTIWCMRVNWFEHKELYMKFVNNCAEQAKKHTIYAAIYAADAAAAAAAEASAEASADDAYAAIYADDADAAIYASAADASAYAADAAIYADDACLTERKHQTEYLLKLLTEHHSI